MSTTSQSAATDPGRERLELAIDQVNSVVLGKQDSVELAFSCLLAGGHLLIEDIPGVGKTTLAQALAMTLGADYRRIQFTADLLPADILGVSVYRRDEERFEFHSGPIFAQLVLADEVNRATPKTQSALLEAMAESHVTIEGKTRELPEPFFVIATQNPLDTTGTFPLPDSQLDRFLLSLSLGYPDQTAERQLLVEGDKQKTLEQLQPCLDPESVLELQNLAHDIYVSESLLDYVQALLDCSRNYPGLRKGLSPRAGLALVRVARALALIRGRDFCVPEDVKQLFPALALHRLQTVDEETAVPPTIIAAILEQVAIP
jgi:MoxR-like ATPase